MGIILNWREKIQKCFMKYRKNFKLNQKNT